MMSLPRSFGASGQREANCSLEVVLAAAESLSVFSERGRIVPEVGSRAIREIFVYRFRLMYQVFSSDVRILAVLHGAMDFDRWLRHT